LEHGLALALVAVALAPIARAADTPVRHPILDPAYGVGLYEFYQERYFSSLTELMVSQHFGRVSHHADEAEVLRGGLLLSYGLHKEASAIFERLIEKNASPAIRNRAWFYLAKIRYQRGMLAESEDAIHRIQGPLPEELEEELVLLHGNLLMARGDYARAAVVLQQIDPKSDPGRYVRFNLGVALIKSGATAKGGEILDEIGVTPASTEELRSLRDKANLALGFAALQNQDAETARQYLERVRLDGMLANKALLAYGWAADELQKPKEALVPWMELAKRDASDAAVLEAKLAIPYAMAQLGANGQSLENYGKAIASFEQEGASLDEAIAAIRSGRFLDELVARNPGQQMGWFWNIEHLPSLPHAAYLAQVMARHGFQEAFKNYRDLLFLAQNLRDWKESLGILDEMLDNKRKAFAERLPQAQAGDRKTDIAALLARRENLSQELQDAQAKPDVLAFADARERGLEARIDRARDILARTPASPEADEAADRLRRVAGALQWQLSQEFASRVWDAKKSMRQLGEALDGARAQEDEVGRAQVEEPRHFDDFAARIAALRQRIDATAPHVDELAALQRVAIEDMAVAELDEQKERLRMYANQARFAVAQIYDRSSNPQEGTHAPAQ
jgi:hypothetical protein